MSNEKSNFTDPWYLQEDKIKFLYDTESHPLPTSKSMITSRNKDKLKKTLSKIPLKLSVKTPILQVDYERQKEGEIATYHKLVKLIERLVQINMLLNLNEIETKRLKGGEFVYFNGTGRFELHEKDPETVRVQGKVRNCDFVCNCSKKWFSALSSSLFRTLLDAHELIQDQNLNIFFIGTVIKRICNGKELLILSALYISGSTQDIYELYKTQE